jgi:hypothetical protein
VQQVEHIIYACTRQSDAVEVPTSTFKRTRSVLPVRYNASNA